MKRLRFVAALHFLIAIGHVCSMFALDKVFDAYGIKDIMHQMVSGHIWILYALTIGLAFAFCVAGLYATLGYRRHPALALDTYGNHHHCCALQPSRSGWWF